METIGDNFATITSSSVAVDLPSLADVDFSSTFKFWLGFSFQVPSLLCYLIVLTHILTKKTQRQALHNHSIIVLLFIALCIVLFDYSWTIDSFRRGEVWLQAAIFCEVWWFLDYGFFNACTVVLAWASFERHILIFHTNLVATKRRRILIHYLPLISILVYLIIFYTYVIFFPPCENQYDFTLPTCGAYPCYMTINWLFMWDAAVHGVISTFLSVLFNVGLFVAILRQKCRHRRNWRNYRKMAFQLLSISLLYISLNLPLAIIFLVQSFGYPEWGVQIQAYLFFFTGLLQYLLPFVCLPYASDLWPKIKRFFTRKNRRIVPVVAIARVIREQHQEARM